MFEPNCRSLGQRVLRALEPQECWKIFDSLGVREPLAPYDARLFEAQLNVLRELNALREINLHGPVLKRQVDNEAAGVLVEIRRSTASLRAEKVVRGKPGCYFEGPLPKSTMRRSVARLLAKSLSFRPLFSWSDQRRSCGFTLRSACRQRGGRAAGGCVPRSRSSRWSERFPGPCNLPGSGAGEPGVRSFCRFSESGGRRWPRG